MGEEENCCNDTNVFQVAVKEICATVCIITLPSMLWFFYMVGKNIYMYVYVYA